MSIERIIQGINSIRQDLQSCNGSILTDEMRQYLRRPEVATQQFHDFVFSFQRRFELRPEDTASLLAQWMRETV